MLSIYYCRGLVLAVLVEWPGFVLPEFLQVPTIPFLQPVYVPFSSSLGPKYINHTTHSGITHQPDEGTKCVVELFKPESQVREMACVCFLLNIKLHGQLSQFHWTIIWLNTMVSLPSSAITPSCPPCSCSLPCTCFGTYLTLNLAVVILHSRTFTIFADTDFQNSEFQWFRDIWEAPKRKSDRNSYTRPRGCPGLLSLSNTTGS